ncbi:hypothetical protein HN695_07490 [Candidatus Woesearchaeota archaeon]|nr:hypothetical protein [Candidatus Woesearchaeota archaeon]MBT5272659.1 hypothetical protein [Candidatus Woesearchaeota archaeon]MBT6041704.1 hypothetical protein [Candidatus Woesearchaeota archaeon]MBT6337211.1 hypothetical protein [Candidatus Woesearchaeota archaeon]MBT7928151.1 hypothetical protein [Candidatus Woesearchaeota archaeon]
MPEKADVDINIQIQDENIADFKHFIARALSIDVPATDQVGRRGTDFDPEPRLTYSFRNGRRVDLSLRVADDKGSLEHVISAVNWTEEQRLEMRKAKHFFGTTGAYHRSNHGINGISVERLVLMYGSLENICGEVVNVGLVDEKKTRGLKPNRKDVTPLKDADFEINFPNDDGKGIFNWWVGQNPKMWERIVLGAKSFLDSGIIKRDWYDFEDFKQEYSENGWHVFEVNTRLEGVDNIERTIFEKANKYFNEYVDRVSDFDVITCKDKAWIAMKPYQQKTDQSPEQLVEENIKLFRNYLDHELNEFMPYVDEESFIIKPRKQLIVHGHKAKLGPKYVVMVSNDRYFDIAQKVFEENPEYNGKLVKAITRRVERFSANDIEFDILDCGGGSIAKDWVDRCIGFGAKYFINVGMVGSLVPYMDIGDIVISGEIARIDKDSKDMGTESASLHYAPLNVKPSSSPILIDTLIDACDVNELNWQITKMATVTSIYSESRSLIRRLRMDGHATTVDAETSHIATTVGFRSQGYSPDHPDRLHFGGIYFVSDRFTAIDHKDMRGDSELRRTRSQQVMKAAIDTIKMIEERYEQRRALL